MATATPRQAHSRTFGGASMHDDRIRTASACIGLGYIGLPTAAVFATRGVTVIGVDVKRATSSTRSTGARSISSSRISKRVDRARRRARHAARRRPRRKPADAFIIAVPTPFHDGHRPDLTYVEAAGRVDRAGAAARATWSSWNRPRRPARPSRLAAHDRGAAARPRPSRMPDGEICDVHVAYCPERVLPGRMLTSWSRTTASSAA